MGRLYSLRLLFTGFALMAGLLAHDVQFEPPHPTLAAPAVIYAVPSATGPTGDGSLAHPYRTLWMAGTQAGPGTTVYVRGGVYLAPNEFISVTTATAGTPVTFMPAPGEHVIFDGTGSAGWNLVTINQSAHVVFDGFEMRNAPHGSLDVVDSTDVTVRNIVVHDAQDYGIVVSGQQLVVENNQGWNLSLRNTGNSNPVAGGWASAMNSNPRADGTPSNDVTFRDNMVYDAWGEGIGIYATDGATVYGNTIHDCFGIDIYLSQARNVLVDRNYLYSLNDVHNKSGWRATGITMATEPAPSGLPNPTVMLQHITLTNNVMVGTGFGIMYFYTAYNTVPQNTYQDLRISYNTIRAPQTTAILFQPVKNNSLLPSGVVVSDNIIETGGTSPAVLPGNPSAWSFANNDWPGGVPAVAAEPGSFAADARFVSPVLSGPVDGFRLQAGSPAIGRAAPVATVTTDYAGAARDATHPSMGAFEYATRAYHLYTPLVARAD